MTTVDEAPAIPPWTMEGFEDRHPSTKHVLSLFDYEHLPFDLKQVSERCWRLAIFMAARMNDGPELTVALRSLLEAKDAFVRQRVIDFRNEGEQQPAES